MSEAKETIVCPVTGRLCSDCSLNQDDPDCINAIETCADLTQLPMSAKQQEKLQGTMFQLSALYRIDYNTFCSLVTHEVNQSKRLDSSI